MYNNVNVKRLEGMKFMNMEIIVGEIRRLFNEFNHEYYNGELKEPMIVIQSNGAKKTTQGWCTTNKIWSGPNTDDKEYELTICSEFLSLNFYDTCDTVAHEMVHLYNLMHNVKDVNSNGKTHNKKYKEEAERRGLIVEKDFRLGFAKTSLSDDAKKFVDSLNLNREAFKWKRILIEKPKKTKEPKPTFKYICPSCNSKFTSKKEIRAICSECDEEFELQ